MYTTIRQLVEQSRDKPIYQVVLEDEQALTRASEEEIWEGFRQRWQVMQASAARALEQPQPMVGGLISGQACRQQLYSQQGILTCTVSGRIPYVSLYRMGQGVHTSRRRDKRRQAQCNFGIENRISWNQREIIDGIFIACLRVRDDCCQCCLASCAGSGRNRHEERPPKPMIQSHPSF